MEDVYIVTFSMNVAGRGVLALGTEAFSTEEKARQWIEADAERFEKRYTENVPGEFSWTSPESYVAMIYVPILGVVEYRYFSERMRLDRACARR